MPANYAQAFCTGLGNIVDRRQPLIRTLRLYNYVTARDINFFPLDSDASSILGADFGIYSHLALGRRRACGGDVESDGVSAMLTWHPLQSYVRQKQSNCVDLRSSPSRAVERPGV